MALWIIEESSVMNNGDELRAAIDRVGGKQRWLSVDDEMNGRYGLIEPGTPTIFRGSFQGGQQFVEKCPQAKPGLIGEPGLYRCTAYYPLYEDQLLNQGYVVISLKQFLESWTQLQDSFDSETLFVRPDEGTKSFSGQVVSSIDEFVAKERPYIGMMDQSDRVVVAIPRRIEREFRFVVVKDEVVGWSQYRIKGERDLSRDVPEEAIAYARETVKHKTFSEVAYMLDVAETWHEVFRVVEVNMFSCSELYLADPSRVVQSTEKAFS